LGHRKDIEWDCGDKPISTDGVEMREDAWYLTRNGCVAGPAVRMADAKGEPWPWSIPVSTISGEGVRSIRCTPNGRQLMSTVHDLDLVAGPFDSYDAVHDVNKLYSSVALPSVCFSGLAGSGKDTAAAVLIEEFGHRKMALADPLKEIARREFGWDGEKDEKGRRLLQVLGTEAGRAYNENLWVGRLIQALPTDGTAVVTTDARFPNELDALRARGFVAVMVVRIGHAGLAGSNAMHPSETALDGYGPFDAVLYNTGPLESFKKKVSDWFRALIARRGPKSA